MQSVLPFGRKERAFNRKTRLGRPKKKWPKGAMKPMAHVKKKAALPARSAVLVTVRLRSHVPNLRTRRRFNVVKGAFVKFCASVEGFRLVHFAVLSNHLHFVVEADGQKALSLGMRKLLHSVSRRLNALCVKEKSGAAVKGKYTQLTGWLGRVFTDRFHSHVLKSKPEIDNAVRYVLGNARKHYGTERTLANDTYSSAAEHDETLTAHAQGYLLQRAGPPAASS